VSAAVRLRLIGRSRWLEARPWGFNLLSLILWGMIWGVVGMLLAAPIAAFLKLLLERLELTAPLARLLAGRLGSPEPQG
jgi:Zn-dependent protease